MSTDRETADLYAVWYIQNKVYLKKVLSKCYVFDEDILSDVFLSIYNRILNKGLRIKDYMPYMLRALKYSHLKKKEKASRLLFVSDYNLLPNNNENKIDLNQLVVCLDSDLL